MKKFLSSILLVVICVSFVNAQKFAKRPKANDLQMNETMFHHLMNTFPQDNPHYVWENVKKGVLTELSKDQRYLVLETFPIKDPKTDSIKLTMDFVVSELKEPRRQDSVLYFKTAEGKDVIFFNLSSGNFYKPISTRDFAYLTNPQQNQVQTQAQRPVQTYQRPQQQVQDRRGYSNARQPYRDDVYGYGNSSRIIIPTRH